MKTFFTLIFSLAFSGTLLAQCPTAGRDTAVTYCQHEFFDVEELRSGDADTNGVFIDPAGDTMTNTVISLIYPGQYNYFYHAYDTSCPVDTAKYVITIGWNCTYGLTETLKNNQLIRLNPVNEQLILNEANYDQLEIYSTAGSCILTFSASPNTLIDVSKLEGGNYILVLNKDGTRQFQRFVKY